MLTVLLVCPARGTEKVVSSDLLARGAPGIRVWTLNRSPATRAILSTLKLWRPWDPERTALGEPRRPPATV